MPDNKKIEKTGLKKVTGGAVPSTGMNNPSTGGTSKPKPRGAESLDKNTLKRTAGGIKGTNLSANQPNADKGGTRNRPAPDTGTTPLR